ncbi:CueP family metal-binding protein [Paenalkalicoccus suaedae]|uniref:CueP family metal-binding protein n=1 Tax=Paenalkalicoccus suaedae TaxID=2592382 RepID=A0A859FBR5_9BACI|nr:CueP family metal-binding protein [Paenalkalicoccus suaedae]QKS69974.1 CueP family metal-binding protein [Paenalkalicoccus suaedae]
MTGCQGELVEEEFDVVVTDTKGTIVLEETVTTFENGFMDLWLPRDDTFTISIKSDEGQAESTISTFDNDPTCITTIQLL